MFIPKIKEIKKRKVVSRPALNFQKKKKSECYGVFIITYFHQKIINT